MIEHILKDHVFIDFGSEICFGSDQMYLCYPIRFSTVGFQLMSTALLEEIADRIRITEGFKPMHPMDEYTEETCDSDGWYDFFYEIHDLNDSKAGICIEFIVVSDDAEDNEELYTIDLTADERTAMYNRMDEQCRGYLGKGCDELLAEARKRMEDEKDV